MQFTTFQPVLVHSVNWTLPGQLHLGIHVQQQPPAMHPAVWAADLLHQLRLGITCASTAACVLLLGGLLFHPFWALVA